MKSRIFNLILFFVLFTFGAQAQVKGHEYYCWMGSLAKNIDCEIRMEHDNDHLALGETGTRVLSALWPLAWPSCTSVRRWC